MGNRFSWTWYFNRPFWSSPANLTRCRGFTGLSTVRYPSGVTDELSFVRRTSLGRSYCWWNTRQDIRSGCFSSWCAWTSRRFLSFLTLISSGLKSCISNCSLSCFLPSLPSVIHDPMGSGVMKPGEGIILPVTGLCCGEHAMMLGWGPLT